VLTKSRPVRFARRFWRSILVVAIGIPVVTVVGVVRWNDTRAGESANPPVVTTISPDGSTTTSVDFTLTQRSFRSGDCVTWDQSVNRRSERSTKVVPCDQPHLFEYVSTVNVRDVMTYPTDTEWDAIIESRCAKPIADYLGYPIDPAGKFYNSALTPTDEGWKMADRELVCGIGARGDGSEPETDLNVMFSGAARGQDQADVLAVGTCYAHLARETGRVVPCTEPHVLEVTGHVDITTSTKPNSDDQWRHAASACESQAKSYAPAFAQKGYDWNFLYIEQTSWDVGRRKVECTLGKYDEGGDPVNVTGSAKE
jgi:hypothetical protein